MDGLDVGDALVGDFVGTVVGSKEGANDIEGDEDICTCKVGGSV